MHSVDREVETQREVLGYFVRNFDELHVDVAAATEVLYLTRYFLSNKRLHCIPSVRYGLVLNDIFRIYCYGNEYITIYGVLYIIICINT